MIFTFNGYNNNSLLNEILSRMFFKKIFIYLETMSFMMWYIRFMVTKDVKEVSPLCSGDPDVTSLSAICIQITGDRSP